MNNVDVFCPGDMPSMSHTSTGSVNQTDQVVPTPEQLSGKYTSGNSLETRPISYQPLTMAAGNLSQIVTETTKSLASVSPKPLTEKQTSILGDFVQRTSRGYISALPMKCKGLKCPFIDLCPLKKADIALPIGEICPVESNIIQMWVNKHLIALGIKDALEPVNSFDLDMLYQIAASELIQWRAAAHLSKYPNLIEERQIAATMQGEPIFAEVMSPALEIIEKHTKLSARLKEALVATRQAQIQAGRDMGDPSKKAADLISKARDIAKKRRTEQSEKIKDAEFTVKDEDKD